MGTPHWELIRSFKRGNGIQTFVYEEVHCTDCGNKCERFINLTKNEMRPKVCPKGE